MRSAVANECTHHATIRICSTAERSRTLDIGPIGHGTRALVGARAPCVLGHRAARACHHDAGEVWEVALHPLRLLMHCAPRRGGGGRRDRGEEMGEKPTSGRAHGGGHEANGTSRNGQRRHPRSRSQSLRGKNALNVFSVRERGAAGRRAPFPSAVTRGSVTSSRRLMGRVAASR